MIRYFNDLTTWEKIKLMAGAFLGVAFIYGLTWGVAVGCVVLCHGPEVCGL